MVVFSTIMNFSFSAVSAVNYLAICHKIRANPGNPRINMSFLEYTGCPIMTLFEKTNPILCVFRSKTAILPKNEPKTNPNEPNFIRRSCGGFGIYCKITGMVLQR